MVAGTYEVTLKTPMGPKKGELVLKEDGSVLTGKMVVMKKENPLGPGTVDGDEFSFDGKLKTSVGMTSYICTGRVQGDAISGEVITKKGNLQLTGTRK